MGKLVSVMLVWLVLMPIGIVVKVNSADRSVASTEEDRRNRVHEFMTSLQSLDCKARARAIFEQLPNLVRVPRATFRVEGTTVTQEARSKLDSLLEMLDQEEKIGQEFEQLIKTYISPALRENDPKRSHLLASAKNALLSIANSSKVPFYKRIAAVGAMGFFVDQYDDPEGEMRRQGLPLGEWKNDLITLLNSHDSRLSSVVASSSALSDAPKHKIIPVLLSALRVDDLMVRVAAQNALVRLTGQNFCIDPTDPFERRESGIHQWEQWWALTKEK